MGKNLIQQARGRGGPRYLAPSFRYLGEAKLPERKATLQNGRILDILNCPGHFAPLLQVKFDDGSTVLHIAPDGVRVGDRISAGPGAAVKPGNVLTLREIPEGQPIYNLEMRPGDCGKICRVPGMATYIVAKTADAAIVMMPSKKEREFSLDCRAAIGLIAGAGRLDKPFLKAGMRHFAKKARNKRYPMITGAAQNAVDHPFGNKRTSRKAKQKAASRFAPPGRKVGKIAPRRTGRKK